MDNTTQAIPMDNVTLTVIVAGLVIPFLVNLAVELFVRNKTARTVVQSIVSVPALSCYIALLGFWFQDNIPGTFVLFLLIAGGFVLYTFAYHMVALLLQDIVPGHRPSDDAEYAREPIRSPDPAEDRRKPPSPAEPSVAPTEKSSLESFDDAVVNANEDEAIIYGADIIQEGDLIHAMLGFKKLAGKGFSRSKELYLNLVCRLSRVQRTSAQTLSSFWQMNLNELADAKHILGTPVGDSMLDTFYRIQAERMCWHAIAKDETTGNVAQGHKSNAEDLLRQLTESKRSDKDTQACIAFVEARGIVLPEPAELPEPVSPGVDPKTATVKQTLKHCLKCGSSLHSKRCSTCGFDHVQTPVSFISRVDPRTLQISNE